MLLFCIYPVFLFRQFIHLYKFTAFIVNSILLIVKFQTFISKVWDNKPDYVWIYNRNSFKNAKIYFSKQQRMAVDSQELSPFNKNNKRDEYITQ